MAQADQTIQNATFPTVRADINNNLAALFSANSGGTAPSVTVAFQDWIDTSGANPIWKKRNAANNAWITLGTIGASTIAFEGTLPSQTSQSGKYLTTNGTVASWGAIPPGSTKEVFTSSGTWVKPTAGTIALVTIWGGGGSGARFAGALAGGGGGGACVQRLFQLSDLPGSAAVTIGAGGAAIASGTDANGNVGGTSSFGSLMSAFGGGGGGGSTTAGGGGGSLSAGSTSSGGNGHSSTLSGGSYNAFSGPSKGDYGGASGDSGSGSGGTAFWGGGGGGGCASGSATQYAGGDSLNGGDGGTSNTGTAASVPSGGGGASNQTAVASGAGGAGLCIVYIW
jgi:hypothetical protein